MLPQTLLTPKILRSWSREHPLCSGPGKQNSFHSGLLYDLISRQSDRVRDGTEITLCVFVFLIASLSAWKWESRLRHWEQCARCVFLSDQTADSHVNVGEMWEDGECAVRYSLPPHSHVIVHHHHDDRLGSLQATKEPQVALVQMMVIGHVSPVSSLFMQIQAKEDGLGREEPGNRLMVTLMLMMMICLSGWFPFYFVVCTSRSHCSHSRAE